MYIYCIYRVGLFACICSVLGCDVIATELSEDDCMLAAENLASNMTLMSQCSESCGAVSLQTLRWGEGCLSHLSHKISNLQV